jgi:hypothetical protein
LRACVRADANTRAQRDAVAHCYRRANKHRHADQHATPTATPTPIPTIQVGNLSVPDPRVTNPELFDLRNPNAPIPQFVNAMKMAGIEITAEQVAQGITYEALEDKDGNPFIVAVYNPDPALFPEQYRDLAGPIPLLIATGKDTWLWNRATIRLLAEFNSLSIGVLFGGWFLRDPSYMGNKYICCKAVWVSVSRKPLSPRQMAWVGIPSIKMSVSWLS